MTQNIRKNFFGYHFRIIFVALVKLRVVRVQNKQIHLDRIDRILNKRHKNSGNCLFSSADLRRFLSTNFRRYLIFVDFQGLSFESTK
jgi:hypothetical protein